MQIANSENFQSLKPTTEAAITCAEVDETISMALRAVVQDRNGVAANPFVAELTEWVRAGLVTAEGCVITRDEFRRRLEALKARYAGRAVALHVCEAAEKLDALVCNRL